jgi:hypothetical protein
MKTRGLAHDAPCEKSPALAEPGYDALYVATDLRSWRTTDPSVFCRDVQINDTAYRRLDPEYFAWLRSRLALAKEPAKSGRIDPAAFDELGNRLTGIEAWALDHFGAQTIMAAIRNLTPRAYDPPRAETESRRPEPAPRDDERINRAIRLVDAIREKAVDLGWNLARLYRHAGFQKRPFAADYGLVCYIGSKDRIGDVTRQAIEIVGPPPRETRLRFYNPDADQPWIRRIR